MIDVIGQGSPEQIYFGTESRARDLSSFAVPLEVVAAVFFLLIDLIFIGVGQTLGRAFNSIHNRIEAYTINLTGSLAAVAGFSVLSYLLTPPSVWFAIIAVLVLHFVKRSPGWLVSAGAAVLLIGGLIFTADTPRLTPGKAALTIWSPYYKIHFDLVEHKLFVNNIQHQRM